nr:hypothetical protein [Tanacetum cinerariifolium]
VEEGRGDHVEVVEWREKRVAGKTGSSATVRVFKRGDLKTAKAVMHIGLVFGSEYIGQIHLGLKYSVCWIHFDD